MRLTRSRTDLRCSQTPKPLQVTRSANTTDLEARRNDLFREPVGRLYERYFVVTRESLRRHGVDGDLDAVARYVFSALEGSVLQYLVGVDETSIRAGLHALWAVLVDRVGVAPTAS